MNQGSRILMRKYLNQAPKIAGFQAIEFSNISTPKFQYEKRLFQIYTKISKES